MSKARAPSALLSVVVAAVLLLVVEVAAFVGAAKLLARLTPTSRYATRDSGPVGPDMFGANPMLIVALAVLLTSVVLGLVIGRRHRRRGGVMFLASALFGLATLGLFGAMGLFDALSGPGPGDGDRLIGPLIFYAILVVIPLVVAWSGLSLGGLLPARRVSLARTRPTTRRRVRAPPGLAERRADGGGQWWRPWGAWPPLRPASEARPGSLEKLRSLASTLLPPLRPASAASAWSLEKLRSFGSTLLPPSLAISRCLVLSIDAKPRPDWPPWVVPAMMKSPVCPR